MDNDLKDLNIAQTTSSVPQNATGRRNLRLKKQPCSDSSISVTVQGFETSISRIATLPLLFVNKQIYNEVAALVYPKFSSLNIIPSIQKRNDDTQRLSQTSPIRWSVMREVTSLKIIFSNELVKKFGEERQDVKKGGMEIDWFMPWPNTSALMKVIETLENLIRVEIVVQVLGDPSLTLGSKSLQGDDCFSWLFPFREELKSDLEVDIGFGTSGRCSAIYQKRWDELCVQREKLAENMLPFIDLAI